MIYLNLGCGNTFDSHWINLDVSPSAKEVKKWDVREGLPFDNDSIDACYSSHVFEHLNIDEARKLLSECIRVLKPEGIIRLVVPDLEAIAKIYLDRLAKIDQGIAEAESDYDWILLEMYDQTVRNYSGGQMGKYLSNPDLVNREFILSRIGFEAEKFWQNPSSDLTQPTGLVERLRSKNFGRIVKKLRMAIARFFVFVILGQDSAKAFDIGLFRTSGEVHQWMYDRFSMTRVLQQSGFINIRICQANESSIPSFSSYCLDIINGKVRKPDSLFIEACKPDTPTYIIDS
ncbi:MAG: methyltransferase domain-containing protein [Pseudanabaenaceae cyanobacterium bins.68]|nr:methyltransferase domain-containing protein [Pseudanabaenaceae cyanobacterium bins.68]